MSNTAEYEGNIYEIGKFYLFGDKVGSHYFYAGLKDIDKTCELPFVAGGDNWRVCKDISINEHGAITKAPIKLIDGEVYQFDYETGANVNLKEVRGMYDKDGSCVWIKGNNYSIDLCTNIVKLIPEVKL